MASFEPRVASADETEKRSQEAPKLPEKDSEEKTMHIRFLVSNGAAGSVIGKGGSTISDFQSKSGARIQLSRNQEFFPGTTDRIIMISGSVKEVVYGLELILDKLNNELHAEDGNDAEPRTRVRLVVPNSSCGSIIGKGGATIKSFIEESQASIKISPPDNSYYGLRDRLVTVSGTIEEQLRAIDLILAKLTEDAHYSQSAHAPFSYGGGRNANSYAANGAGGAFPNHKEDASDPVTIGVSDEHIGLVLGRGGRSIMEITQITGARIKISDRGDFISGTTNRKVTITGTQRAIRQAESMINQKVAYASDRATE